jgi:acetyl-CoA C-acetyltransferase
VLAGQGITAENIAKIYGISTEEQDIYTAMSQNRSEKAQKENFFRDEIIPVMIELKNNENKLIDRDEHIRYGTTVEKLTSFNPSFKIDGTITAGNSSGINDGAAAFVVMSAEKAQRLGVTSLVKILSFSSTGVDPSIVGMGPGESYKKALKKANLSIDDIDLFEINEAFAAQTLAVTRALGTSMDKINVNGGAISLGHQVGASGSRILVTLIYEMIRRNVLYGMASLCLGGGMGISIIVNKCYGITASCVTTQKI